MAQAGGSATANGILLQVLGTLGHAVNLTLRVDRDPDDAGSATLIIEPVGGGGDLQLHWGGKVIAEQWKARSGGHTWSLAEVIDHVLPDLYCAVETDADEY